ncbi:MAG: hypothetical protein ACFFCV_11825 [Promethearchaeota archaeon]
MIPESLNTELFKFKIVGTDIVRTGSHDKNLEYVELPELSFFYSKGNKTKFKGKKKVKAWLGNDFIVGMNFLTSFEFCIKKKNLEIKI